MPVELLFQAQTKGSHTSHSMTHESSLLFAAHIAQDSPMGYINAAAHCMLVQWSNGQLVEDKIYKNEHMRVAGL